MIKDCITNDLKSKVNLRIYKIFIGCVLDLRMRRKKLIPKEKCLLIYKRTNSDFLVK